MPLVKNATTSLAQGVSQQAESQRFPSQATEQINAYSSPIKGLVKRPPSKFLTKVDLDTTNKNNTFIHTINRDSDEQYVLAIDKQNEYPVTAVSHSNDTITTGTALAANTPVRFLPNDSETTGEGANGTLPTGLEKGTTYFTKTNNVTTQVSATAGGAAIPIGKVSITDIKLESVKHTDGRWVDGVFAVTFAAGHGFEVGDIIQIDGLTGDAALILNATEQYLLRKPTQVMDEYDTNGTAIARSANQFLLGKPNGDTGSFEDNLGYAVDERWVADNDDDGWNMYGASVHWVFYKDGGNGGGNGGTLSNRIEAVSGDNLCNELIYNTADNDEFGGGGALNGWAAALTNFQAGDLLRLGSRRNTDKSIRAVVASVDGPFTDHAGGTASYRIKLRNYIKLKDLVDSDSSTNYGSTSPPWNYIAYWGDTTSATPAASNPRQILSTDITNAHIGLNESIGSFSMYTGGIRVYDVNSKQEQTLNIDSGLSYLTNTTDPASELSAVTVADYTFLVNKTQKVAAGKKPKYVKNNEAFINVRTADYGKRYTVKVGGEVHKQYATADAHSYAMIQGIDSDGKERPIAKLSSRAVDSKFNGYLVRVIQNWRWDNREGHPLKSEGKMSNGVWNSTKKHKDKLPPAEHRINEYVGIEYNKEKNEINIWVNFNWAERTSVTSKRTTLDHVLKAVDASPLGDDFKLEETDSTGNVLADSNNDGVPDNSVSTALFFHQVHVGPLTSKLQLNVTPYKGLLQLEDLYYGPETSFGTVNLRTEWVLSAGYVSPSAGKNIIRGRYTGSGVHQAVSGMDFGHNASTKYKIENGEFFYKSAKWTGKETQKAVGTERIAAVLACNGKRTPEGENFTDNSAGNGEADTGDHGFKKANGLPLEGQFDTLAKEECLGLTWKPNNSGTYLSKYNGSGGIDGSTANWHVQQDGYVIALKHPDGKEFKISVSDDLGGRGLKLTYYEVDEVTDLPDRCRHNHVVKVIGNAREEADDYYLRFKADTEDVNSIQHGRWVESLGYETVPDLDKTTMPIGLIREADNTFTLKELDWNERQAGDDQSNPFPSFVGNTINDIFLFRNRLGFLSGENIIFSEAGEYFNFFRTTVAALLDSAPIDVTASTNKVSKLHSAIPYNERLIIFSDQTQFVLDADPFLSPKTVTLSPSNEIDNITSVKPIVSGNSVYYAFSRTGYSGVGALSVSQEDADQMEVDDVTGHIPKYIKGTIRKFAATSNEDVFCCITDEDTEASLYVYKYHHNAQNQKVQSAWFKYTLGTTNDYITDISFIGTTLYIIIRRSGVMCLESLVFEDDVKDTNMDYQVLLDQRVDKADVTVNGTSSVTMPAGVTVTANTRLVTDTGVQLSSSTTGSTTFTPQSIADSPSAVTVPTNNFFIGVPYSMEYTFSQPFLKSDKITESGRYQIQRAFLEYANARSFTVDVTHNPKMAAPNKLTVTNTFANDALHSLLTGTAELQEGFFKFGVMERNDRLQLLIKNSTPYPSDFLSIDYEARAFSRGSRWRG